MCIQQGLTHRGVDKDPNFVCDVTRGKLQGTRDTVTADVKLRTEIVIIKHRHSHCRPVGVAGVVLKQNGRTEPDKHVENALARFSYKVRTAIKRGVIYPGGK